MNPPRRGGRRADEPPSTPRRWWWRPTSLSPKPASRSRTNTPFWRALCLRCRAAMGRVPSASRWGPGRSASRGTSARRRETSSTTRTRRLSRAVPCSAGCMLRRTPPFWPAQPEPMPQRAPCSNRRFRAPKPQPGICNWFSVRARGSTCTSAHLRAGMRRYSARRGRTMAYWDQRKRETNQPPALCTALAPSPWHATGKFPRPVKWKRPACRR
mmetsp:Transcript_24086/g.60656  ORF Transcript_24086/g.60656 Transcript_24086/m.60656 type:complete len:213 (-) Transcript_24086:863-1501(-)